MTLTGTPLLRSQENVWEYVYCFAPDNPGRIGCNVFNTMELAGPVDLDAFRQAVGDVARRHEALRTVFATIEADPLTRVADDLEPAVRVVDLSAHPPARRAAHLAGLLAYESHRDFDLRDGPLWTVTLVRRSETSHLVAIAMTHVIADGWSTGVFLRDLMAAYRARLGDGPPLAPLPLSYEEALAAPQWSDAELARRTEYWKRHLAPLPDRSPFTMAPLTPGVDVQAEANLGITLPGPLARGLGTLARQERMTPFVLLLGAYRVLLGALTGWDRVVIGSATFGRESPGSRELIGQFTHNLYVPTAIAPHRTLREALGEVRTAVFGALRNNASFKQIAPAVNPDFDRVRPWPYLPLYHAWFISAPPGNAQGRPDGPADRDTGLTETRTPGRPRALPESVGDKAALWAKKGEPNLTISDDRRAVFVRYNPFVYDRDEMVRLVTGYRHVLGELVRDPHQRIADLRLV
jgi:hypothetical protein